MRFRNVKSSFPRSLAEAEHHSQLRMCELVGKALVSVHRHLCLVSGRTGTVLPLTVGKLSATLFYTDNSPEENSLEETKWRVERVTTD